MARRKVKRKHQVDVTRCRSQGANQQLVVWQGAAHADQPALQTPSAAEVAQLKIWPRVAQRLYDGQRGVDVPAGPAARHQTPHGARILSAWSRG